MNARLAEFLERRAARYERLDHAAAVTAQEQAAATGVSGHGVAKVVLVKAPDGLVMAVLPATRHLDLDRLRGLVGHGALRLATVDEIGGVVPDCAPGAVPPFGALYGLRTLIDRSLVLVPRVTMPAGDPGAAIRMSSREFLRLVDARVGDFAIPVALLAQGGVVRRRPRSRARTGAGKETRA
jgi:Ala-tRNA(Pro) deacylase